jgi:ATP-dependent Clp protease ATP-binding subunit ClpB
MRPEFLNRVDEIVMFKPLNIEQIREIVVIQIDRVKQMLREHNIDLKVTDGTIRWIAEKGFDPQSGARPVKRLIQKEIINELSKEIIAGKILKESTVEVTVEKGKIKFKV